MRLADLATAVVLMLFAGLVLWDALRLGVGWGPDGPRSGFFPFWLAVLLLLASLGVLVQALRRSAIESFVTREQLHVGSVAEAGLELNRSHEVREDQDHLPTGVIRHERASAS